MIAILLSTLVTVHQVFEWVSRCYLTTVGVTTPSIPGDREVSRDLHAKNGTSPTPHRTSLVKTSRRQNKLSFRWHPMCAPIRRKIQRTKNGRFILRYSENALNRLNADWNECYAEQANLGTSVDGTVPSSRHVTWCEIPRTRSNRFGMYHYDSSCTRIYKVSNNNENNSEDI